MELKFEKLSVAEPKHEFVHASVSRAKVPGGWLICVFWNSVSCGGPSMLFYPDPEHLWDGASLPHESDSEERGNWVASA